MRATRALAPLLAVVSSAPHRRPAQRPRRDHGRTAAHIHQQTLRPPLRRAARRCWRRAAWSRAASVRRRPLHPGRRQRVDAAVAPPPRWPSASRARRGSAVTPSCRATTPRKEGRGPQWQRPRPARLSVERVRQDCGGEAEPLRAAAAAPALSHGARRGGRVVRRHRAGGRALSDVLAPALRLAEEGFPVTPIIAWQGTAPRPRWARTRRRCARRPSAPPGCRRSTRRPAAAPRGARFGATRRWHGAARAGRGRKRALHGRVGTQLVASCARRRRDERRRPREHCEGEHMRRAAPRATTASMREAAPNGDHGADGAEHPRRAAAASGQRAARQRRPPAPAHRGAHALADCAGTSATPSTSKCRRGAARPSTRPGAAR